jgi:hypothetical protein
MVRPSAERESPSCVTALVKQRTLAITWRVKTSREFRAIH